MVELFSQRLKRNELALFQLLTERRTVYRGDLSPRAVSTVKTGSIKGSTDCRHLQVNKGMFKCRVCSIYCARNALLSDWRCR